MASRVGDYLLFETLGKGAFGKVKLGVHEQTGEQVAVKIMDKSDIKAKEMTMNVRREIAIMKALKHKNIVNLRQVLTSKTKLYIVMDLVTGGELFTKILSEGKLEESVARKCFQQLVDGIEYCHRRGVCHRDLKPENLLIDETTGELKITDFGLSAMKGASTAEELLHTQCGSPNYCAPEIIAKHKQGYSGTKVDAWSCGIILFTLLAGYLPFYDDKTEVLYKQIQFENVKFPRKFPEGARDLVVRLLHKNPEKRYTLPDCKRHPWFLVDYEADDAAGKQATQVSTPIRRRRRKRQSVDQDPMKGMKFDGMNGEPRSRSGGSLPQNGESSSASTEAAPPGPPLPPIITTPGKEGLPPRPPYTPSSLPSQNMTLPLPLQNAVTPLASQSVVPQLPQQVVAPSVLTQSVPPPTDQRELSGVSTIPVAPVNGIPSYTQENSAPMNAQRSFATTHPTTIVHGKTGSTGSAQASTSLEKISQQTEAETSSYYHGSDAPPPYEKVASTRSFSSSFAVSSDYAGPPSIPVAPPPPPPAYVPPPAYGPVESATAAPPVYAPPPPPDYTPPREAIARDASTSKPLQHSQDSQDSQNSQHSQELQQFEKNQHSQRSEISHNSHVSQNSQLSQQSYNSQRSHRSYGGSSVSGDSLGDIPPAPALPPTPQSATTNDSMPVTPGNGSTNKEESVGGSLSQTGAGVRNNPWVLADQNTKGARETIEKPQLEFESTSATSFVTEKGSSSSKESGEKGDQLNKELEEKSRTDSNEAATSTPKSLFEQRRAMFGASINRSDAETVPTPALDSNAGRTATILKNPHLVENTEKSTESFETSSIPMENSEVSSQHVSSELTDIAFASHDNPESSFGGAAENQTVIAPTVERKSNPESTTTPIMRENEKSVEERREIAVEPVQGQGNGGLLAEAGEDDIVTRGTLAKPIESSGSSNQGGILSFTTHDTSSNTVIVHEDEEELTEIAPDVESDNNVVNQVRRYRRTFSITDFENTNALVSRGPTKGLFAEAARISMSWGVVLKRNIREDASADLVTEEELNAFIHLLDFWEQYDTKDVEGKELASPLSLKELSLAQNCIEKLSSENLSEQPGTVGTAERMGSDLQSLRVPASLSPSNDSANQEVDTETTNVPSTAKNDVLYPVHENEDRTVVQSTVESTSNVPQRLEVTPSTVRDPFRPSLGAGTYVQNITAPSSNLPPVQSTLAANEAAAAAQYGAHIPPNVRTTPGKVTFPNSSPNTSQERRSVSNASSRSSERSEGSKDQLSKKRDNLVPHKAPEQKDVALSGKSYFGFRRHTHKKSWPTFEFQSRLKPDRCLIEVGRILTSMGGKVMMKRGENKMKYEGEGKMLVSIVCTLHNGFSKMVLKRGKKDKSKTDYKQFLRFFQSVHARFMKAVENSTSVATTS